MTRKKVCAALLTIALCAAALTACGGGGGDVEKGVLPKLNKTSGKAVTVSGVEELLNAIAPGAEITVAPGYYNMSAYINDLYVTEGDDWNAKHPYVQLEDCYDGAEVIIQNVKSLSISGGGATADTEIVIDPEYGTVFTFKSCSGVKLSNLTLGHTQPGVCAGNVVDLNSCENIELRNMDLYGCGVIGLNCESGTGDVFVYDSVIRDCSDGPVSVYGGAGAFEFRDCAFTGSAGGGYFDGGWRAKVSFHNCSFGPYETYRWKYADGVETENCTWDESVAYPDGEYPDIEPDGEYYDDVDQSYEPESLPENMEAAPLDMEIYGDTSWWRGYVSVNPETGESVGIPSGGSASEVLLYLRTDGTGSVSSYYKDRTIPFLWEKNAENPAKFSLTTLHDGAFELTCYRVTGDNPDFPVWLSLRTPDALLWMY